MLFLNLYVSLVYLSQRKKLNIHLHILQRYLRRGIIPGIQQYRQRREARDEQGYCGEEAEDGLEAVEGRVHGADSPVL